jgi:hypothetical protein
VRAQQAGAIPRIGLLSVFAEGDPEEALIKELMHGLQELGWVNGRNVRNHHFCRSTIAPR